MYVLDYWHTVSDDAEWKRIFDSDPLGRAARDSSWRPGRPASG